MRKTVWTSFGSIESEPEKWSLVCICCCMEKQRKDSLVSSFTFSILLCSNIIADDLHGQLVGALVLQLCKIRHGFIRLLVRKDFEIESWWWFPRTFPLLDQLLKFIKALMERQKINHVHHWVLLELTFIHYQPCSPSESWSHQMIHAVGVLSSSCKIAAQEPSLNLGPSPYS